MGQSSERVRGARARARPASRVGIALAAATLLGACAGGPAPRPDGVGGQRAGRVQQCRAGDARVASEAACLDADGAACYALAGDGWCTGERGNTCPAGSGAVPDGAACPPGARCFEIGESLLCAISIR